MINQSDQQDRRRNRHESEWSISTANLPASYSTDMEILVLLLLLFLARNYQFSHK